MLSASVCVHPYSASPTIKNVCGKDNCGYLATFLLNLLVFLGQLPWARSCHSFMRSSPGASQPRGNIAWTPKVCWAYPGPHPRPMPAVSLVPAGSGQPNTVLLPALLSPHLPHQLPCMLLCGQTPATAPAWAKGLFQGHATRVLSGSLSSVPDSL